MCHSAGLGHEGRQALGDRLLPNGRCSHLRHDEAMTRDPVEALKAAERVAGSVVLDAAVPTTPGVYCWWYGGQPVYVAAAQDLRAQLQDRDAKPGQRPVPPFRQFARSQAHLLGDLRRGAPAHERTEAIDRYISACEVGWLVAVDAAEAEAIAVDAEQELLEASPWQARPGEDKWLRRYLDDMTGGCGRVYVEVPIGSPTGRTRRIDAVRFPTLEAGVRYFDQAAFTWDVQRYPCHLIEVKRTLNRTVIGQLIVARDLAATEWTRDPALELALIALVTMSDPALEPVCQRHGIQVHVVE